MEVEVYADLLFLINGGMDGLCFYLTARLLHRRLSLLRIAAGAALGGLYAVAALLLDVGPFAALCTDLGVCLVICAVVFLQPRTLRQFPSAVAAFLILSMVMGGIMTALYHLLNRVGFSELLPAGDEGIGTWLFAALALIGGAVTLSGGRRARASSALVPCRVRVELNGRVTELEGIVDTGNRLRDPLSGRAVICAERQALAAILPRDLARAVSDGRMDEVSASADGRRIRLIPADTATGRGILTGFLPDRVEVICLLRGKEEVRVVDAVVAAADLTETLALVPSELIT